VSSVLSADPLAELAAGRGHGPRPAQV